MTSIYLAEDEIYAMMALKQKILDLGEDYVIAGTADNGVTALEEITELHPDIVLTDIRMPDMDGLTLLQKLQEAGSQALTIIVSGYQDFQYAQQAVRLGASDYLLKPVNPPELQACLKKNSEKLKKHRKNIISFLIGDETFSFENTLGQEEFTLLYTVFANPLGSVENNLHPSVRYIPNAVVEQKLHSSHSCSFWRCFDGFFSNEKVVLLSSGTKNKSLPAEDLQHFLKLLEEESGTYVTIHQTAVNRGNLPYAVRSCRNDAIHHVIPGKSLICSGSPPAFPETPGLVEMTNLFSMMLTQGQEDLLRSNIKRLFQSWEKENRTCASMSSDLIFIMDTLHRKSGVRKSPEFSSQYFLENIISFSGNMPELADNFCGLLLALFTAQKQEAKPAEDLVESLIDFFHANISSNITLQDLEDKTGFSKVYICRMFKKSQNTTPIDYFTRLKIARAQEMLTEFPNLSLREISDFLGFSDVYYFSKVFKKITGNPPSEMRG